jgi:hypothetical protein
MKDEVYLYNQARWESLAKANAVFTRPNLYFDKDSARERTNIE